MFLHHNVGFKVFLLNGYIFIDLYHLQQNLSHVFPFKRIHYDLKHLCWEHHVFAPSLTCEKIIVVLIFRSNKSLQKYFSSFEAALAGMKVFNQQISWRLLINHKS